MATIITQSRLLFRNSCLYAVQKVLKIDISSFPSIHLRATANIATVAGKKPKMMRPRSENIIHTLMHDVQYRAEVARQSTTYNQPSYTSFYFGSDINWANVPVPNFSTPGVLSV